MASEFEWVNVRSGPSMDYEVLRWAAAGFPLRVVDREKEWSMVKDFRDRKGWVANRLLAENNTVILKISKGNLRTGPSSAGAIVEEIEYGTILWIEEIQEDWLKIINKDGVEGWLPRLSVWPE